MSHNPSLHGQSGPPRASIAGLLAWRAAVDPERVVYSFARSPGQPTDITFAQLHRQAVTIAMRIRESYAAGERVLMAYPPGYENIAAFFGCLYAGLIPVPTAPLGVPRDRLRAAAIVADAQPALVLTVSSHSATARAFLERDARVSTPICNTDEISAATESPDWVGPTGCDVAYLQYTSGSTSKPKGVMITHSCLMHNLLNIELGFGHTAEDVSVNWLPHFHDMGLVYGLLQPVFSGFRSIQMSAATFVRRPIEWLRAITKARATHSGAPNFAYEMGVRNISPQDREGLDLGSWRVAYCGAEPVRHSAVAAFQQAYAAYGFEPRAFCPAYGLAEATLKVCGGEAGLAPRTLWMGADGPHLETAVEGTKPVVSCGRAGLDTDVRIVDPLTLTECAVGQTGEIWVSGPGVAAGYWNRPAETARTFRAVLPSRPGREHLRTGDLGFVSGGELFVAGRLKDTIIIRGQNYFAEDIESIVREASGGVARDAAAFSIEGGNAEQAVVIIECRRADTGDPPKIVRAVRRAVGDRLGLTLYAVAVVGSGQIPRTSSGKVQRHACRQAYLDGTLRVIAEDVFHGDELRDDAEILAAERATGRAAIREQVQCITAQLTGKALADPDWDTPLLSLGIDSLRAMQLERAITAKFGVTIEAAAVLSGLSPNDVLKQVLQGGGPDRAGALEPAKDFLEDGVNRFQPSIEQERLWAAATGGRNASLNLSSVIRFQRPAETDALLQAIGWAFQKHTALRARFDFLNGQLQLRHDDTLQPGLAVSDLRTIPANAREQRARQLMTRSWELPFQLSAAPLIRFDLLILSNTEFLLALCAHHLICDHRSLILLAADLIDVYSAAAARRALPPVGAVFDYRKFAEAQRSTWTDGAGKESLDYWAEHLSGYRNPRSEQRPGTHGPRDRASSGRQLDEQTRRALQDLAAAHGATTFMALVAATVAWLKQRTGRVDFVIACPVTGRWPSSTQDAFGLFAYPLPVRIDASGEIDFDMLLRRVRLSMLAAYQHQQAPFSRILAAVSQKGVSRNALTEVICNLIPATEWGAAIEIHRGTSDFDLDIAWIERSESLQLAISTTAGLLPADGAEDAAASLAACVAGLAQSPSTVIPNGCVSDSAEQDGATPVLAVAATFTAGQIRATLDFWRSKLGMEFTPQLLPDGQVFQSLLDPGTRFARNSRGLNVVLVRLYDWTPGAAAVAAAAGERGRNELSDTVSEFIGALRVAAERSPNLLVCFCPGPETLVESAEWSRAFDQAEERVRVTAASVPGLHVVTSRQLLETYSVSDYTDAYAQEAANAPYVPALYASIGTMVARKYAALSTSRPKVVVLDCDNTLWKGVCGEDSPGHIVVDSAAAAVQRAVLALRDSGVLVALCSRNEEADVWAALAGIPGMLLRRDHLTTWRINWKPKAESLHEIAEELGLDLGTFVFLDDDPVQCAEIRANCPQVMAFELPSDRTTVGTFLQHLWPLDIATVTDTDRNRAESYRLEDLRREAEKTAPTLSAFIDQLRLECRVTPALPNHFDRIAQLSVRTTQMNANPVSATLSEVQSSLRRDTRQRKVVHLTDRFGDYGIVGVMSYEAISDALVADTFLLSCRALGRGVEHRMIRELGEEALRLGLGEIRLVVATTARNKPARSFLSALGGCWSEGPAGRTWNIAAQAASNVIFDPDAAPSRAGSRQTEHNGAVTSAAVRPVCVPSTVYEDIARHLHTPGAILSAVRTPVATPDGVPSSEFSSPTERTIAGMVAGLLRVESIGLDTDFFTAGGDSLLAVELLTSLYRTFQVDIAMASLFGGALTVRGLAQQVESAVQKRPDEWTASGLVLAEQA